MSTKYQKVRQISLSQLNDTTRAKSMVGLPRSTQDIVKLVSVSVSLSATVLRVNHSSIKGGDISILIVLNGGTRFSESVLFHHVVETKK